MEAKRRRLSKSADPVAPPTSAGSPKRATRSVSSLARLVESLQEQLAVCDFEKAQKSLAQLKKKLSSKTSINEFLRSEKSFPTLIAVFHESFSKINDAEKGDAYANILRETVSVIANCCHFSLDSCLKLKPANVKVISSALRILESGTRTSWTLKASVLRLVANLCEHKETAMCIVDAPQLVDRIAMMVNAEDETTSKNALRIVRLLSSAFSRVSLGFSRVYSTVTRVTQK
uniref:CLASP_N domain-containing protein n=1 Tax=Steinernema glaseri TaxID=37863 RepID=A0A1I7YS28_9BILA